MKRLALAALLALAQPAAAQVRGDAEVWELLLQDQGIAVERDVSADGAPMLRGLIDGMIFLVHFYDCGPSQCETALFSAGFDMPRPMPAERVNEWNRDTRFGKAYLDLTGDPILEMDVILSGEGLGQRNFNETLALWQSALSEFRGFLLE